MNAVFEGPDEAGTIMLKGELTIQYASRLKEVLVEAMGKTSRLAINLEGVDEVDLSCLQVFCSAHRSALASGGDIVLTGAWPEPFRRTVETSALSRGKSCRSRKNEPCLWKSGGCL